MPDAPEGPYPAPLPTLFTITQYHNTKQLFSYRLENSSVPRAYWNGRLVWWIFMFSIILPGRGCVLSI